MATKKDQKLTSQTVRISDDLRVKIGHRLVDLNDSFQGYVVGLIEADLRKGDTSPSVSTRTVVDSLSDSVRDTDHMAADEKNSPIFRAFGLSPQEMHRMLDTVIGSKNNSLMLAITTNLLVFSRDAEQIDLAAPDQYEARMAAILKESASLQSLASEPLSREQRESLEAVLWKLSEANLATTENRPFKSELEKVVREYRKWKSAEEKARRSRLHA